MRLTTRSNLAMRTLMFCAVNNGRTVRKQEVAQACNASGNHLGQVIMQLAQFGYVSTQRGRLGGFQLAVPAGEIIVGQVLRRFEAPVPLTTCMPGGEGDCPLACGCRLSGALTTALGAFYAELDKLTLDDLVTKNPVLDRLLLLH